MDRVARERWETTSARLLAAAVAIFVASLLPLGLHSDDLEVFDAASRESYADALSSTFLGRFYRPLVVLCVKASIDAFGRVALPIRVLEALLVAACVYVAVRAFRRRASLFARVATGLVVLASPATFVAVTPFAVGIADLVVGLAFLLSVEETLSDRPERRAMPARLFVYGILALLAKESGVLVVAFSTIELARRRRWSASATLVGLAVSYVAIRHAFVVDRRYPFATGFFFEMYSPEQLEARFGRAPHLLYAYDVLANLSATLFYAPYMGRFALDGQLLFVPPFVFTSAIVLRFLATPEARRECASLIAVVVLNAVIGFGYVRPRVVFVGSIALAIAFHLALDDLWQRPQRAFGLPGRSVAIAAFVVWWAILVDTLVRLHAQATSVA